MVSTVCNRISSCFTGFKAMDKVVGVGVAGISLYLGGIPALVLGFGAYYAAKKYMEPALATKVSITSPPNEEKKDSASEEEKKPVLLSRQYYVIDRLKFGTETADVIFDHSVALKAPMGNPPQIIWKNNSCFLSSMMWSLILNEPTLLAEIPNAIRRRFAAIKGSINQILADRQMSDKSRAALLEIGMLVSSNKTIGKADLCNLCALLKKVDDSKDSPYRLKELISLLELYQMVDHCQMNTVVDGDLINGLRDTVRRVNGSFQDHGKGYGDANEVFRILADLIFEGSSLNQNLTTTQFVKPTIAGMRLDQDLSGNPRTGELHSHPIQPNWGRFELPLIPGSSVKALLEKELDDAQIRAPLNCRAEGCPDYMPFTVVRKVNQLDFAPPLLVLNIKRLPGMANIVAPLNAEPRFELDGCHFKDNKGGAYELYGVSKHQGTFSHYVADFKRDKSYFHCDDLKGKAALSKASDFQEAANTGYILLYRKIPRSILRLFK